MVRSERETEVEELAHERVDERLLDLLLPPSRRDTNGGRRHRRQRTPSIGDAIGVFVVSPQRRRHNRRPMRSRAGALQPHAREAQAAAARRQARGARGRGRGHASSRRPMFDMIAPQGAPEGMDNITEMLQDMLPKRKKKRTVKVSEARRILLERGARQAGRHGRRHRRRARARREARHHLPRRDRQDRRRARVEMPAGPTSHAKACSATCCRSSKARTCRRSTAW